ncbi:hypothetical protein COL83_31775 [Bacillus wiedmannii]|nr:hypothetical protein COL83_31775 [Bacillus wiedmannii]
MAPNQTYFADYQTASGSSTGIIGLAFELNGTVISGTSTNSNSGAALPATGSISASAVFNTGPGVNILTLSSGLANSQTMNGTIVNVIKLA